MLVTGPDKKLRFGWWATHFVLSLCGHYLTASNNKIPGNVRAVIIGGGDDIQPMLYGLAAKQSARYDAARDELELNVFRLAASAGVPILGICRGAQLINIALGGNLHQDIRPLRNKTPNKNSLIPVKHALLRQNSRIKEIFGRDSIKVNSLHHQAIDRLGEGLQPGAHDHDEFIQAVEDPRHAFFIGVQWHPEYLPYLTSQRSLFAAFAAAIRESKTSLSETRVE